MIPRGLDHIVHAVHDLDAAAEFYRRAGFTVGARNRHPWGTHNRIVQLQDFFVELLTVAEPEKIAPHAPGSFSFGAFQRDYLARRQGLSMLLLSSRDADADARGFAAAGIGDFKVFDFAREGRRPDGVAVELAFSLAFAVDLLSPDAGFAVCQHRFPQNFWNADFQNHPNGARAAAGVVMVADNPTDHHVFVEAFTGSRDLHSTSTGITARTARGDIEINEAVAFRDRFGVVVTPQGEGASFVGLRIAVDDLGVVESALARGAIAAQSRLDRLVVLPCDAFGATLIFERAAGEPGRETSKT
ncbi:MULTISPECIES: VOC family protein [Rhodopseudomonas]|uniref:VOC family protein n=1 Tax=Rhodopseudomonas TaxID=1073 RepID=UPI0005CB6A10|nr:MULTISPECIES: VOC family protein [Rhodopseudomonas]MDF3809211.1 VOC family protein [Rhodopseudomonas sp. BAL398]WOK19105.1 VOC family protein [Rhodopseudomonas sp. BAL398]